MGRKSSDGDNMAKSKFRKVLSKTLWNGISIGAGLYVGLHEGQGKIVDSGLKYTLLSTPAALEIIICGSMNYLVYRMKDMMKNKSSDVGFVKRIVLDKNPTLSGKELEKKIEEYQRGAKKAQDSLEKIAPNRFAIVKSTAKATAKTAVKTGVGYAAGYFLGYLTR